MSIFVYLFGKVEIRKAHKKQEEMKMDFAIPAAISQDLDWLRDFIRIQLVPDLPSGNN